MARGPLGQLRSSALWALSPTHAITSLADRPASTQHHRSGPQSQRQMHGAKRPLSCVHRPRSAEVKRIRLEICVYRLKAFPGTLSVTY